MTFEETRERLGALLEDLSGSLERGMAKGPFADLPPTTLPFRVIAYRGEEVVDSRACIGENIDYEVRALAFGVCWDRIEVVPTDRPRRPAARVP